jgi:hypothetical protein
MQLSNFLILQKNYEIAQIFCSLLPLLSSMSLIEALTTPARPVFLFGSTPPREDTSEEKALESCKKFAARSAVLATDGFIVYDIQDEGSRESSERPFPFRKTMDPSYYASLFPAVSGFCLSYHCFSFLLFSLLFSFLG